MVSVVIMEARRIISYLEQLPEEAVPPESLWHSPFKCAAWIEEHHPLLKDKKGRGFFEFDEKDIERSN